MKPLYTIEEVCDILRIKRTALYDLMRAYKLKRTKIGGSVRFTEEQVQDLIKNSTI